MLVLGAAISAALTFLIHDALHMTSWQETLLLFTFLTIGVWIAMGLLMAISGVKSL